MPIAVPLDAPNPTSWYMMKTTVGELPPGGNRISGRTEVALLAHVAAGSALAA